MAHGNKKYSGKMGIKALYVDLDVYGDLEKLSKYSGFGSTSMLMNHLMKEHRDKNMDVIELIKGL